MRRPSQARGVLYALSAHSSTAFDAFTLFLVTASITKYSTAALFGASAMAIDSAARMVLPIPVAAILNRMAPQRYGRILLATRAVLISTAALAMLIATLGAPDTILILSILVVSRIASVFDQYARSRTPLIMKRFFRMPFGSNASLSNLFQRGSLTLAPILALYAVDGGTVLPAATMAIISAFSLIYPLSDLPMRADDRQLFRTQDRDDAGLWAFVRRVPVAAWYVFFNVGFNLCLGGVTYLLLFISERHNTSAAMNLVTPVYVGLVCTQFACIIWPSLLERYSSPTSAAMGVAVMGSLVLGAAIGGAPQYVFLWAEGAVYGLAAPMSSEMLLKQIERKTYLAFTSLTQTASRLSTSASVLVIGYAIDHGITDYAILSILGVAAISVGGCLWAGAAFWLERDKRPADVRQ